MSETPDAPVRTKPADRRDALIASARRHFVEKGFEATSLDDLIADTGGSRRNIYELFGGKEGVLGAVFEQIISEIAETADLPVEADMNPRDWLIGVGTAFVRQMLDPEIIAVFRQFIANGAQSKNEAERLWQSGPERFRRTLAAWLTEQQDAGLLDIGDPDFAATMLPEMFRGSLQIEMLIGRRRLVSQDEVRQQVERATDLFLKGCEPNTTR
ncbi:TetR/AcrR family transcriptional regulator [Cognatiyoonia sp. IB215446]|uniref:TetR/AcrR family transcriptional regulator n=1 Tax=Cognatiyoonia sp. IB215446 TaxID=3097355 RepID=UPI002A169F52|nr:TetR/AcrR family transcriptional regulator [Cognatiyoonia sp. IB215446]MDX8347950.1 TetR/AcrR family transcriptional regulator [Cognatiyoonia sp. IB215446]